MKNFISILIVLKAKYNKYINKNKSFNDNCQRAIKITIKVCDHYAQIIQLLKKYFKRGVASITVRLSITKPCIFQYIINDKVVVNMITGWIYIHLLLTDTTGSILKYPWRYFSILSRLHRHPIGQIWRRENRATPKKQNL